MEELKGTIHAHRCLECRRDIACVCKTYIGPGEDRTCERCKPKLNAIRTWLHPRLKMEWIPQVIDSNGKVFNDCWRVLREEDCNCPDAGFDEDHEEHWEWVSGLYLSFDEAVLCAKGGLKFIGHHFPANPETAQAGR